MIGKMALAVQLCFIAIPLLVILGIWKSKGKPTDIRKILGITLAFLVFGAASYTFGRATRSLYVLRSLRLEEVEYIKVAGAAVEGEADIAAIVASLNSSVYCFSEHAGFSRKVQFEVKTKTGTTYKYSVARYPTKGGVVIFTPEELYSQALASALLNAGINIDAQHPPG